MYLAVKELPIFRRGIIYSLDIRVSNLHETGLVICRSKIILGGNGIVRD